MEEEQNTPEYHTFNYEDGNYRTLYTRKFRERKPYTPPDAKKFFAFIPGTILKVHVKDKSRVKKGDPLLVLQAMKMNNIITAHENGTIKKVYVKTGDVVTKTQLLLEFK